MDVNLKGKTKKFTLMESYNQNQKKWVTSEEVCHSLMISKRTLQSYRDRGILPFAQIGRKIYYKASDIDEYLDRHYIKANYQKGGAA
jgi:MerR family transcriptional regulator, repressor of the yfmOP operon